ncbi:centrosomal protein 20 isoform X2 [Equus quagga]|uniref:centrosomal protein 20 isoform X2 n=1 Tax=Equus quagga TaxID=89248 RepID=UPI001EE1B0D4|nr:centrosomal protein 20 isoform X2 [Equus quagga]
MATVTELKAVLKDTLEKRGVLGHLRARIRAEVFNALDDESEPPPPLSHENLLINELIREYLEFNKYKYTASVLMADGLGRKGKGTSAGIEEPPVSPAVKR